MNELNKIKPPLSLQPVEGPTPAKSFGEDGFLSDAHPLLRQPVYFWDRIAHWLSDQVPPLLVKETRQSLKSRQFQWTFLILLIGMVSWSFLGTSYTLSDEVEGLGPQMLIGYLWLLAFPLFVVVPFTAFRTMVREFEDDTLQLISITTMSPREIVLGKMGSAVLQMIVYLSAVVPGIAFTYLLSGVDLIQIGMCLACFVCVSIGLVCLGFMVAGLCLRPFLRIVLNLVLLVFLATVFGYSGFVVVVLLGGRGSFFGNLEVDNIEMVLVVGTSSFLALASAVSLVSFPTQNRSTAIRVGISCLFAAVVIWSLYQILLIDQNLRSRIFSPTTFLTMTDVVVPSTVFACHFWVIFGSMTAFERAGVSERVRRTLPTNVVAHAIKGLYLPGPGRGYLFALTAIFGWCLVGIVYALLPLANGLLFEEQFMPAGGMAMGAYLSFLGWRVAMITINLVFATGYLSGLYLIGLWLKNRVPDPRPVYGLALFLAGYFLILLSSEIGETLFEQSRFTIFHAPNWMAYNSYLMYVTSNRTLASQTFGNLANQPEFEVLLGSFIGMCSVTFILLVVALFKASRELALTSSPVPARVMEELERRSSVVVVHEESVDDLFVNREQRIKPTTD